MTTPHKSPPPPPPPRSSPPRQLRPANRPRLLTPPSSPAASSPPGESPHLLASPPRSQIPAVSSLRAHPPSSSRRGNEVVPFRCHPRCPRRRLGHPQPPPEPWSSLEPTSSPVAAGAEFFPIRGGRRSPPLPPTKSRSSPTAACPRQRLNTLNRSNILHLRRREPSSTPAPHRTLHRSSVILSRTPIHEGEVGAPGAATSERQFAVAAALVVQIPERKWSLSCRRKRAVASLHAPPRSSSTDLSCKYNDWLQLLFIAIPFLVPSSFTNFEGD